MSDPSWSSEWLEYAKMDYAAASHLMTLYPLPLEIICFHCEQAAEKALKGFLAAQGEEPPRTHDLSTLCGQCATYQGEFQALYVLCSALTPYGVQARYPSDMDLDESDTTRALDGAKQVIAFVQRQLAQ